MVSKGSIKVSVDTKNLDRRLRRITKKLDEVGNLTVREVATYGRDLIQAEMPKNTGESAESIGYQVVTNSPGYHEARIIQISFPHPEKERNDEWFNIPLWMFNSPNAVAHYAKSNGDIIAMRNIVVTLRNRFGNMAGTKFKDPTIFK